MKLHVSDDTEFLIIDECTQAEYNQLKLSFNKEVKNYKFNPLFKKGLWDGHIQFMKGRYIPASTYMYIKELCKEYGFECQIEGLDKIFDMQIDYEEFQSWVDEFFEGTKWKPRYYQVEAAYKILKSKRCLAQLATSAGKTLISFIVFAYMFEKRNVGKILMVVPTVQLVVQSSGDFMEYNTDKLPINIQQVYSGAKYKDDTNIVVGTFQSLVKNDKSFFDQFDCIFVDECHRATAKSLQDISAMCKPTYRFGLSGTIPNTKYADGLTLISNFGPIVIDVKASQLQEEGFISDCKITQVRLDYTTEQQKENFKNAMTQMRKAGKGKDMFQIEKNFVIENEKRFEFIMKMVDKMNQNTMVLFQHTDYGKKIFKWLKENTSKQIYYIDGSIDKNTRELIRQRMNEKDDVVLVASYGTCSTGVSIDMIFDVFFVESYKAPAVVLQSIGRGLRRNDSKGKNFVKIYDIIDNLYKGCYHLQHARERRKLYDQQFFDNEIKDLKI